MPRTPLVSASGIFTGVGLPLEWLKIEPLWLANALFAIATLAGGLLVFPAAYRALVNRKLDMNVLMSVDIAWIIGQGEEATAVVFLFALAELLESWSVGLHPALFNP